MLPPPEFADPEGRRTVSYLPMAHPTGRFSGHWLPIYDATVAFEVLVRGPLVMRGYYRDLARTADAVDQDGWLHTRDVGTLDTCGFLTIVDR